MKITQKELDIAKAEYFAKGGTITVLPPQLGNKTFIRTRSSGKGYTNPMKYHNDGDFTAKK